MLNSDKILCMKWFEPRSLGEMKDTLYNWPSHCTVMNFCLSYHLWEYWHLSNAFRIRKPRPLSQWLLKGFCSVLAFLLNRLHCQHFNFYSNQTCNLKCLIWSNVFKWKYTCQKSIYFKLKGPCHLYQYILQMVHLLVG
jgi:hypothetical protein